MSTIETQLAEFCSEVRRRREALDLTLETLAERAGLTPNYIGTIENGKRDPSLSSARKLAEGLDVPLGELFRNEHGLSPAGLEAAKLFDSITREMQKALLVFLTSARKKRP